MSLYGIKGQINNLTGQTLTLKDTTNFEGHWNDRPTDLGPQSSCPFSVYSNTPGSGSSVAFVYAAPDGTTFNLGAQVKAIGGNETNATVSPKTAPYTATGQISGGFNALATFNISPA